MPVVIGMPVVAAAERDPDGSGTTRLTAKRAGVLGGASTIRMVDAHAGCGVRHQIVTASETAVR